MQPSMECLIITKHHLPHLEPEPQSTRIPLNCCTWASCGTNGYSMHIIFNYSRSLVPQLEESKKHYTAHDVKRSDHARQFQHITGQTVQQNIYAVDNNTPQNLPILLEDVIIDQEIYGHSVPHFQGRTVRHKVRHVDPIIVPNFPKVILERYKNVTLCCDLIQNNCIGFLNNIT